VRDDTGGANTTGKIRSSSVPENFVAASESGAQQKQSAAVAHHPASADCSPRKSCSADTPPARPHPPENSPSSLAAAFCASAVGHGRRHGVRTRLYFDCRDDLIRRIAPQDVRQETLSPVERALVMEHPHLRFFRRYHLHLRNGNEPLGRRPRAIPRTAAPAFRGDFGCATPVRASRR